MAWTLAYSHAGDGTPVSGNLNQLVTLAQKGAPIRIVANPRAQGTQYRWLTFAAGRVFIRNDAVYAQAEWTDCNFPENPGDRPVLEFTPNVHDVLHIIAATTGRVVARRIRGNAPIETVVVQWQLDWFCET